MLLSSLENCKVSVRCMVRTYKCKCCGHNTFFFSFFGLFGNIEQINSSLFPFLYKKESIKLRHWSINSEISTGGIVSISRDWTKMVLSVQMYEVFHCHCTSNQKALSSSLLPFLCLNGHKEVDTHRAYAISMSYTILLSLHVLNLYGFQECATTVIVGPSLMQFGT